MPILAMLLAAQLLPAGAPPAPACRPAQLRAAIGSGQGDSGGMSHDGVTLSIRNLGRDCMLPALPTIEFGDVRGRPLKAARRRPLGMHPGPAVLPVRVAGGHRAVTDLRWVSAPVFQHSRGMRSATVVVRLGAATLRGSIRAVIFHEAGKPAEFDQTPLRPVEGMASG